MLFNPIVGLQEPGTTYKRSTQSPPGGSPAPKAGSAGAMGQPRDPAVGKATEGGLPRSGWDLLPQRRAWPQIYTSKILNTCTEYENWTFCGPSRAHHLPCSFIPVYNKW